MKKRTKEELEVLGRYFDEHGEEEWEVAEKEGKVFRPSDFGCTNVMEAARKHIAIEMAKKAKAEHKTYSFRLPVFVISELKKKAKARHVPYQRFVNEVLTQAATM